jgi:hypothetical protein
MIPLTTSRMSVQSIEGPTLKNWQWRHPGAYYNRRGFRDYREHATHIITLPLNGREVQYRVDQSAYAILQDMRMRAWHRGTGLHEGQGSKVDYRVAITSIHRASGKLKDVNGGVIKWDDDPEAIRAIMERQRQVRAAEAADIERYLV